MRWWMGPTNKRVTAVDKLTVEAKATVEVIISAQVTVQPEDAHAALPADASFKYLIHLNY